VSAALALTLAVLLWPRSRSWRVAGAARGRRDRRPGHALEAGVPESLELLALAMDGGTDLQGALRQVARVVGGPLGRQLLTVAAGVAWGLDDDEAWELVPAHWDPARRALGLAGRAGVPPAGLLASAAADQRRDALAGVETATARLSVRLVVPLGLAFLPAFVLTTVLPVVLALASELVVW
jgi:pilus assembly protein TadC